MNLQETLLSQLRSDKTIEHINLTLSDGHTAYGYLNWEDGVNISLVQVQRSGDKRQYESVVPLSQVVRYTLRRCEKRLDTQIEQ